ncbi:MAG: AAA family ATPase [Flavobacteriales bacterium]|jgi:predicted kinase|nr:AAA family ATPase [Flavobacteriales bacterium]
MKKIILLKGLPASGKSTYAKALVKNNPGMYKRINRDELRDMLDSGKFSKGNEQFVKKTRDFLIKMALQDGKHVIVDDTNLHSSNEEKMRAIAKEFKEETGHQVRVEIKTFDTSVEVCIKRDLLRENPVGQAVIRKMERQMNSKEKKYPKYSVQNPELPKAIICDLDGTLALMHDRGPFEGNKCLSDLPNTPIVNLVKNYHKMGFKILLLSGRDGQFENETKKWLEQYKIPYDQLWMRAKKDMRKDAIIKKELFKQNIQDQYFVEFILDDRNQVVDLWRNELNLPCLQVYYGDF